MRYGFVTNCLGQTTLEDAVQIAVDLGFDCIEVGPSVRRDRATLRDIQRDACVDIHSFIYGRNFLSSDKQKKTEYRTEIQRLLDIAADVGVPQITTSTGVNPALNLDDNIEATIEFWGPLFEQAQQANVRFALEFCPTAGNFALGPYAWRRLFTATAQWPNFGLNYDPSHLVWQFIDPYEPLPEFGEHIFSVHAKDTVIWHDRLSEHGILTPYKQTEKMAHGPEEARAAWWEYRLPGDGKLDWQHFLCALDLTGYDGALILEHEAPAYMGSREAVLEGLGRGLRFLQSATNVVHKAP